MSFYPLIQKICRFETLICSRDPLKSIQKADITGISKLYPISTSLNAKNIKEIKYH